jgi:2-phospho-L-lactate guanylyltransferase
MVATAILPVKRFGGAKRRLGTTLGPEHRAALAAAMLDDVLAAIARCRAIERVLVVTGEPVAQRAVAEHRSELVPDPLDAGHSEAARLGVTRALEFGAACAALLPGDCPLISSAEIDDALARMSAGRVAILPDRHGTGTNGLLISPPDAFQPAFGPGSRARHESLARRAGLQVSVEPLPSLGLDVDTPEDLAALRQPLGRSPERAPSTAAVLGSTVSR